MNFLIVFICKHDFLNSNQNTTVAVASHSVAPVSSFGMVAPLSGQSLGLARGQVTHGIRELVLCKGSDGKVGVRCQVPMKYS